MTEIKAIETEKPKEPRTFIEKSCFLRDINRRYLRGEIPWESLWYYEQRYGFGQDNPQAGKGKP